MDEKELYKIYLDVHKRICRLLDLNIEPLKGVKISDRTTCDENFIYVKKESLKRYSDGKKNLVIIAGILAHKDTHYIFSLV